MKEGLLPDNRSFIYGEKTITYRLLYCDRRTLEIAVHPDRTVVVKAPMDSDLAAIEKKVEKRARWILKQLRYFRQFTPRTPQRCYVNGETHLYLGRQYRLKIAPGDENSVKLLRGFFHVICRDEPSPETTRKLLRKWYAEKASLQFHDSLDRCWPGFHGYTTAKPTISIRRMKTRWGSLSDRGTLTLNTELVKAPKICIDYVLTHELCHLKYRHHGPEFYRLLGSLLPDWEKIKQKLELNSV